MSNAARKARKAAGRPAPAKPVKEGTPLLERTITAREAARQVQARGLLPNLLRLAQESGIDVRKELA